MNTDHIRKRNIKLIQKSFVKLILFFFLQCQNYLEIYTFNSYSWVKIKFQYNFHASFK